MRPAGSVGIGTEDWYHLFPRSGSCLPFTNYQRYRRSKLQFERTQGLEKLAERERRYAMMLDYLEQILLVLAVGSGVAIAAKRIGVPYNVALVVVGLLLVLVDVLPQTPMNPEVVLLVFLPILVFHGALSADATGMGRAMRPILALAVPGVAVSLLGTAVLATWTIGLPFTIALLLGAILAITDTVSVLLAFRSVRVPHRLAAIMEGESLFNDGTALVLVSLAAGIVIRGQAEPIETARMFFIAIGAGALLGAAFGTIGAQVVRRRRMR